MLKTVKIYLLGLLIISLILTPVTQAFADEPTAKSDATKENSSSKVVSSKHEQSSQQPVESETHTDTTATLSTNPDIKPGGPVDPEDPNAEDANIKKDVAKQASLAAPVGSGGALGFNSSAQPKASVDQSTGALTYSYPIFLPEGRAGMTPQLSLNYDSRNSAKPDTIMGLGWEASVPYIKREPVKGTDNLYTKAFFSSSSSGNLIATTDTSSSQFTTYRPESDNGDYLKYTYNSNNSWTVTGKDGRTYTYGYTTASRQDNPADTTKIYKWMLSKIADPHGNEIQYTYIKDNAQIYPSQIAYTYNSTSPAIHTVTFNYTNPYQYSTTVYNAGFAVKTIKQMSSIVVSSTTDLTVSETYTLTYSSIPFSKLQNLLLIQRSASIPNYVYSENFQDTTKFSYSTKTVGWQQGTHSLAGLGLPTDSAAGWTGATYTNDFDQNGYPDVLIGTTPTKFLLNNGTNFVDSTSSWSAPAINGHYAILDLNGDHYPDLQPRQFDVGESGATPLYLNTGSSFASQSGNTWDIRSYIPEDYFCGPNVGDRSSAESNTFLYDINNDGKNDILYFGGTSNFKVFLNNGNGWTQSSAYTFTPKVGQTYTLSPNCPPNPVSEKWQALIDLNGDGRLDYINESYGIYLNTGSGFAYSIPYSVSMGSAATTGFSDINGDGLVDMMTKNSLGVRTFLNTGVGFSDVDPIWNASGMQWSASSQYWGALVDVNSDGFPDQIAKSTVGSGEMAVLGLDDGSSTWTSLTLPQQATWIPMAQLKESLWLDVNSDGVNDFITSKTNFSGTIINSLVLMGKPAVPNKLTVITSPFGGKTSISYGTAPTNLDDTHASPVSVVNKVTIQNIGVGQPDEVTQYAYSGGAYIKDPATAQTRFVGFHKVTATESGSDLAPIRITDTYFLQDNGSDSSTNEPADNNLSLVGKPYYSIIKNPSATTKKENWLKYGFYNLVTEPVVGRYSNFVYPTESVSKITSSGTSVGTAQTYGYDTSIGEQTSQINLGFVTVASDGTYTDTTSDSRYNYNEYSSNGGGTMVKLKREDVRTSSSPTDTIARIDYYYDSQSLGSIGSFGDLTKQSKWISGNGSVVADITYTYDSYGNVLTVTNPRLATTTYTYDATKSYVATETNALNQTTTHTYVVWMPNTVIDPNGRTTSFGYTALGNLYTTTTQNTGGTQVDRQYIANFGDSGYGIEHFKFVDSGNTLNSVEILDNFGQPVRLATKRLSDGKYYLKSAKIYDALGRISKLSVPYGTGDTNESNMFTATVPSTLYTTTSYDVLDRPTSVANSIGTTSMSYAGVETTTTDANNHQKKVSSDAYGNIVKVKEYNNSSQYTTNYVYDNRNLLTGLTDALGNVRSFAYNNAGWITNSEDLHASGDSSFGSTSWTYDANGNRLVETKPNGANDTRTYDQLDRVSTIDGSGTAGTDYTFVYDNCTNGKGQVCSVSGTLPNSVSLSKTYSYGISGVPTSTTLTTLGNSYTTSYTYNIADQTKKTTYQNGAGVRYAFGDWGLPSTVYTTTPGGTEALYATTVFDHQEKPTSISISGGPTITHTYDANKMYRESAMSAVSGSTTLQSYDYTYDSVNNITQIAEPGLTKAYTYDDLNRLTQSVYTPTTGSPTTYSYSYDAIGNITSMNGAAYTYSGAGKTNPHAVTSVGSNNYTYDDNGNMITAPNQALTWNWQNQPTRVTVGGTTNIDSYYDESGQRFIYQTPSGTEVQAESGYLVRGSTPEVSISLGGTQIGTISGTNIYSSITDNLGTPVKEISGATTVSEAVTYDPFGKVLSQTGSIDTKHGYTGHEEDVDTGLVYAKARYYNPSIGRFASQDPLFIYAGFDKTDPQGMNSYAYVVNNPINNIDPTGLFGFRSAWDSVSGTVTAWTLSTSSFVSSTVSDLNPFSIKTAYAPANITETLPNTYISQGKPLSNARANALNGSGAFADKSLQTGALIISVVQPEFSDALLPDGIAAVSPELGVEGSYSRAASHIINDHEYVRYPGMSEERIANLAKETKESADYYGRIKGVDPLTGKDVNKQYYGSKTTGQVFINTNVGEPTMFPKNTSQAMGRYIRKNLMEDTRTYGRR